jgi:RNA polymerase sigma-70 factor (ECF subfamily)
MPEFPETSHSLIARVKDLGDGLSWIEFLGIYQPVVFRMARRRGLQDADAQDVMQQVFLSISRSIEGWIAAPDQPPFRAWLTTIARNAITRALMGRPRDVASGSSSVMELLERQTGPETSSGEIVEETRREIIRWAAEQIRPEFTEETWQLFWRTAIEGIPIAEVAKTSGRSTGAVYVARFRVSTRLKEVVLEVSQHWDPEESH